MKWRIWRLRIWRRIRHRYLSMDEMGMLNDHTLVEALMMMKTFTQAERIEKET